MANVLYPKFKEILLGTGTRIDLSADNIKAILVDLADYTYSAAHQFLSDVPSGAREETSANLASKTITNGVFDAADVTFTAAAGDPCEAVIVYKDTGSAATSNLIVFVDTATGLPATLNGGDVVVAWDNGANKIFAL
jgi:hypothetical protein